MKKLFFVLVLLTVSLSGIINAQGRQNQGPKPNPEMRKEMRQYFESQILPILKPEHDAFDKALPAGELAFLQAKRQEAGLIQKDMRSIRKQVRALVKSGTDRIVARDQFKSQFENIRNKRKALAESMKPFIEKNKKLIDKTIEKLKPYSEKWQADRKAIREKYQPQNGNGRKPNADKIKERSIIKFLLWDSEKKKELNEKSDSDDFISDDFEEDEDIVYDAENSKISAYPNPAVNEINIQFEIAQNSKQVFIRVADLKGFIYKEIPFKNLNKGKQNYSLNISDLNKGQYVYSVEIDGKIQSGNFSKL
jgi:hypothetical protein